MPPRRRPGPAVPARFRRSGAFAATSAVLAWLAHGIGGGALPSVWLLLVGGAVVGVAALPFLGREATWPRIAAGLAAAQAALHVWLALTASHAGHHGGHGSAGRMLAAHAVATAAAVVWLRYLEHRVWSAARDAWLRLILHRRRWLPVPGLLPGPSPARPAWLVPPFHSRHSATAQGVRGPPVLVGP